MGMFKVYVGNLDRKATADDVRTLFVAFPDVEDIALATDKEGNSFLDIELYDKVGVLRLLAKASGLLDNPDENDKPSVIDVNVVAPPSGEQ